MTPWYPKAGCCINPVENGSGMKVKMLEYMACGLRVVTTTVRVRGIAMADGEHALICRIKSFVESPKRLGEGPELRRRLSSNGRALVVEEACGVEKAAWRRLARLESLVGNCGSSLPPAAKEETAA